MDTLLRELSQLTLKNQLHWNTIDKLIVNGTPYSTQFQHIIAEDSYFTEYKSQTVIILYGEVRDFFEDRIHKGYFLQTLQQGTIKDINASEREIVKLHTLITMTNDSPTS